MLDHKAEPAAAVSLACESTERARPDTPSGSVVNLGKAFIDPLVDPLIAAVPQVILGGLPIAITDCATAADMLVNLALSRRGAFKPPAIVTSANGQVLSLCARDREVRRMFDACDLCHADGMPLVFASYLQRRTPRLPERVATTDLFHSVAQVAVRRRISFYLLGSTDAGMDLASANVRRIYPDLELVGAHHGYLDEAGAEEQVRRIAQAQPDILWIGMGVPREQRFALRWREALAGVGVIKTSGGLFDFLSGAQRRAPNWMQQAGLEWVFRAWQEPDRLMLRYLTTSPHALYLLLRRGD
ncbi:WecB/TagA/CpsF family glycosyltransferase [Methylobacterium sp. WL103]|uniref:WecB/TagA/CpsF family glycosyltransferase n=1 Tax=Methylobacterium sp. WL103 TaxID=2603891 RepID=UPI0011CAFA26|nr:WecB/TagA/CpsF family glycosyltransferase [Methylobacterium sp. WL103]TXN06763.1 WecB/TagA/CpsF family glycosyltransferase [Methylobacterium sp. WL103]